MTDSQVWVLVKNGKSAEEVATLQEKDIEVYGLGHVLETLIPLEHRSTAELSGRWDEEGFTYEFGQDWFAVCRLYPFGEYYEEEHKEER